jgi:hypothetical protein
MKRLAVSGQEQLAKKSYPEAVNETNTCLILT